MLHGICVIQVGRTIPNRRTERVRWVGEMLSVSTTSDIHYTIESDQLTA